MTASAWTLTTEFRTKLAQGTFGDLTGASAITYKLFTSSSNISTSSTLASSLTNEVASANGYTTGGVTGTLTASGTSSVTLTPSANISWTASGGSIVARFIVAVAGSTPHVVAYSTLDNTPADVTTTTGNTLTVSNSNPIITIA